jgi:hypothetical protein
VNSLISEFLAPSDLSVRMYEPPHLLSQPFAEYLSGANSQDFSDLRSQFPTTWDVYIMGGVLRNLLLEKIRILTIEPGDMDIVINGASSNADLNRAVQDYWLQQNDFGGAKCRVRRNGLLFDIWRIEDHVNMSLASRPHTIEQLLRHNLIDLDAVLLNIRTGCLYDYGCLAAIGRGGIDLLGPDGISPQFHAAQAAHIVSVVLRTGFELSSSARYFICRICDSNSLKTHTIEILSRKTGYSIAQAAEALDELLKEEPWPTMAT